jgi:hypothetical protein
VKKIFFILSLWFTFSSVHAFNVTNVISKNDSSKIFYFYTSDIDSLNPVDTSVKYFYRYNPIQQYTDFFTRSGNTGLPYKNLFFIQQQVLGFDFGMNTLDDYIFRQDNIKYYDHIRPFTELKYVNGSKKEQLFSVLHSHKLAKNLTVGLDFSLINSLGLFANQKTDHNNLVLTLQYKTSNNKYGVKADYFYNRVRFYENGGLIPNAQITQDFYLTNARNKWNESGFQIMQYLNFFHSKDAQDSLNKQKTVKWRISHTFDFERVSKIYSDISPNPKFYRNIFSDSTMTYDSIHFYKIENTISLYEPNKTALLNFSFKLKHQYVKFTDSIQKKYFNQFIPSVSIFSDQRKSISFLANAENVIGDNNDKDFQIDGRIKIKFSKTPDITHEIVMSASFSVREPSWEYQHYFSNHFRWDNNFEKIHTLKVTFQYQYKNFKAGAEYYHFDNYVYFDSLSIPRQLNKPFDLITAYLYKNFKFGHFGFDNKLVYQKLSNSDVVRLPEFMTYHSLYYNTKLFKVLDFVVGLDLTYNSSYYADAYSPVLMEFYLQSKEKLKDIFYSNFFINAKLKRANFFFLFEHFNSLFLSAKQGEYDYQIPNYPIPGFSSENFSLKFGVSWRFYD